LCPGTEGLRSVRRSSGIVTRIGMDDGSRRVARIFVTGSSDGLGLLAARLLIERGNEVVLHGRNDDRSRDALAAAAGAQGAVTGDLSTIAGARTVADQVNKLGRFVRPSPPRRVIDSRLGKIAFGPLCQQCTEAIVPALLRGQHHHRGKRGLCRMWGVSRAHS
jgi:hypothetical protein